MATAKTRSERKKFEHPDEQRPFELGRADLVSIGGGVVGRLEFRPGLGWSEHVKPSAQTEWCEAPHFQYDLQGTLRIKMTAGTEFDADAGDVTALPSGHDAWVGGEEPVLVNDWFGASNYAR